jgi:hypothetical protein
MSRQKQFALKGKEKNNALREPSPMPNSLPQVTPNHGFTRQVLMGDHAEDETVVVAIVADLAVLVQKAPLELRHGNDGGCVLVVVQNLPYDTIGHPHVIDLPLKPVNVLSDICKEKGDNQN